MWEMEKLLVTSNFSFSRSVFKRPLLQTRKKQGLFGRGLMLPKQALIFMSLQYESLKNTVGKGDIAQNEQFLLFPQCFLPF